MTTDPTEKTYDSELVERTAAAEQAILDAGVQQFEVTHLRRRVVELALRVHDLEQQLAERDSES